MLRRVSVVLALLLLLALGAAAQVAHYLAVEGEGTASVVLEASKPQNGQTAYVTDGGKGGRLGLGGASIGGKGILQYLLDQGVTRLVITCSHPHSDHMDGLKAAVRDPKIQEFKEIIFVDNGYDKAQSLASYYRKAWGNRSRPAVSYSSAANRDAFAGLPKTGARLRVSNFRYDPSEIPPSRGEAPIHGRSIITEYELMGPGQALRVVDLDDASTPLIAKWAGQKPPPKVNVLISAHHGSIKNDVSPILDRPDNFGLRHIIFTANLENHHDHPSPEVLLRVLKELGPDRVSITGSAIGQNVEITPQGVKISSKAEHRRQLAAFIKARIDHHMGISRGLLQRAQAQAGGRLALHTSISGQPSNRILEVLGSQRLLSSKELSTLSRSVKALENFEQALDEVEPRQKRRTLLAVLFRGFDPLSLDPYPKGGKPDQPDPEVESFHKKVKGLQKGDGAAPAASLRPHPSNGGGGSGARAIRYTDERSRPRPTWGGIILGNKISYSGPQPTDLMILAQEDEEVLSLALKVSFADGTSAIYADLTPTELWAAYNFVQPTLELVKLYKEAGNIGENSIGLVGGTNQGNSSTFEIHPAIADTYLARDGMRLDSAFFAAKKASTVPSFVADMTDWNNFEFFAYQWYDAPVQVQVEAGRIEIEPTTEPKDCLFRVRFYQEVVKHGRFGRGSGRLSPLTPVRRVQFNEVLNTRLAPLCQSFDAFHSVERLARTVAVLNWYKDLSGKSLPDLPESVSPVREEIPASWPYEAVFAKGQAEEDIQLVRLESVSETIPIEESPTPESVAETTPIDTPTPDLPDPDPSDDLNWTAVAVLGGFILVLGMVWLRKS